MPFHKYENLSLHYQEYGAGDKILLFIHGLGGNGSVWKYQIEHFKQDYHLITVDRFGHGQSTKGIDPVTAPRCDAEAIDHLMREEFRKPYIALGHSFATFILPEMMKLGDAHLRGAVFIDCTYADFESVVQDRTHFAQKMLAVTENGLRAATERWYRDIIGPAGDDDRELIMSSLAYCNPRWLFQSVAGCREYVFLYPPRETPLKEDFPVLIMEAEKGVGDNIQKSWVNHFKEAQYYLLEKADHFFFVTEHDRVNRRLDQFLSEIS